MGVRYTINWVPTANPILASGCLSEIIGYRLGSPSRIPLFLVSV